MPSDLKMHGRDHLPTGADPIPGMSGGSGIQFDTVNTGGWLEIRTTDTGEEGIFILDTSGNGIDIRSTASGGLVRLQAADHITLLSSGYMDLQVSGGQALTIGLTTTSCKLEVVDHLGSPLLRVTENGTFHIKSGASWVADL